jgi:hypothetical protein
MPLAGFESVCPARERKETHALDGAATGIGQYFQWKDQSVPAVRGNNHCFSREVHGTQKYNVKTPHNV